MIIANTRRVDTSLYKDLNILAVNMLRKGKKESKKKKKGWGQKIEGETKDEKKGK